MLMYVLCLLQVCDQPQVQLALQVKSSLEQNKLNSTKAVSSCIGLVAVVQLVLFAEKG
jgi:hypothetical protein